VHLFGTTALLSGKTHMTGTYKGTPFETDYRYIDTYVEKDGRWRVVAVQITKLPQSSQTTRSPRFRARVALAAECTSSTTQFASARRSAPRRARSVTRCRVPNVALRALLGNRQDRSFVATRGAR